MTIHDINFRVANFLLFWTWYSAHRICKPLFSDISIEIRVGDNLVTYWLLSLRSQFLGFVQYMIFMRGIW